MRKYELITILKNSGEVQDVKDAVKEIVTRNGAEILSEDDWGVRNLTFEMQKVNSGFFVYFTCNVPPQNIKEIGREMRIQNGVLRHMFKVVA